MTHLDQSPCIQLVRLKFELTNQDSAGGKNFGLSEIFIRRMERYFPLRRTDLAPFPLKHILLDKMLKDHGKVAVSSAVSCFLEINITHTKFFLNIYLTNSNTIFAWWKQLANFSRGKVCPGSMQTERAKPQEIRSDQSTIFQKIRS